MTFEEARDLVIAFEADQRVDPNEPLGKPRDLQDVLEILRRDQVSLFAAGAERAAMEKGVEAEALHAQIELAWGEAQLILSEILWRLSGRMNDHARQISVRVAMGDDEDLDALAELRRKSRYTAAVSQALPRLAAEHIARGAALARGIIERYPDHYLGYRVAADYYSLREDWAAFEAMAARIEETNPTSTGLVFLRGVAALRRDQNIEAAAEYFREALRRDPQFTRAQTELLLMQSTLDDTLVEFQRLEQMNPRHQIVLWSADVLEQLSSIERRSLPAGAEPANVPSP